MSFKPGEFFTEYDLERESLEHSEPPLDDEEREALERPLTKCEFCGHSSRVWPGKARCGWCGRGWKQ